jgi:parvulin-like peptidyl-prolyl isomerase
MAKRKTTGLPKKSKLSQANDGLTENIQIEAGNAPSSKSLIERLQTQVNDEAALQRLIIQVIGGIVGLLVVIIGVSLAWQYLYIPNQTVATVNGESISVAEFQERVRLERTIINQRFNLDIGTLVRIGQDPNAILQQEPYGTWWQEITGAPELLGSRVLNEMVEERLIEQAAREQGIEVDNTLVQEEVEAFFSFVRPTEESEVVDATATTEPTNTPTPFVSPTPSSTPAPTDEPTPTPTPEMTEEPEASEEEGEVIPTSTPRPTNTPQPTLTFEEREANFMNTLDDFYGEAATRGNLDRETVEGYFAYQAMLGELRDSVTADLPRTATYVNVRHILVTTEEEANAVLDALNNGESFDTLARAVSTDTGSGSRGGELGWATATTYVPEFRDATLEAEIGVITEPVQSDFGYHIIQVRDREEREMSDSEYERARNAAFSEWIESVTSEETNDIVLGDNWPQFVPTEPQFIYAPVGVEVDPNAS